MIGAERQQRRACKGSRKYKNKFQVEFDEQKINSIFAELDQSQKAGATVGLAIRGQPVYRRGFGLASMDLPVLLTPTVRMRIASTSKHFACFAYLLLCEDGLLTIDDTIGMHLPELSPIIHGVTMRQVMGNISGLWDAGDLTAQFSGPIHRQITAGDLLDVYRDVDAVAFPPGERFSYNNGAWHILGAVIEKVTGKPLEEVLKVRVFDPVGMGDTLLRRWDRQFIPNCASAHIVSEAGGYERGEYIGGIDYGAAGAIVTTVDDMLRWMAHMSTPRVGNAETWRSMMTPQTLLNGTSSGYSLGLTFSQYRGVDTIFHGGGSFGATAQMVKVPGAQFDVIVMVNRGDADADSLARKILDACLPNLEPPRIAPDTPPVTGIFRSRCTGRVLHLFKYEKAPTESAGVYADGTWLCSLDGHYVPVEWNDTGSIQSRSDISIFKLTMSAVGDAAAPSAILLSDFGNVDELSALTVNAGASAGSLLGRYRSTATRTEATIAWTDEGLTLTTVGRFGDARHKLTPLTDGVWQTAALKRLTRPPWGLVTLDRDGGGFTFSTTLTRNVHFQLVVK